MSFLLWHNRGAARIASPRLVLRAAEVPLLQRSHELREQLERMLRDEAERIAATAREAAQQAHNLGREHGLREGRETMAATLTTLAQSAAREHERLRGDVGALALQVVRKLLGNFAEDALLAGLADTAAQEALPTQQMTLVVHPDLRDAVQARLSALAGQGGEDAGALRCEVRGDAACERTACRIETEHGSVDASLDTQLARLAQAWGVTQQQTMSEQT